MKIVFWGTPKYAAENLLSIVNGGNEVIAVVTQPDRKRGRGKNLSPSPVKQIAIDLGIPVYTTQSIRKDHITKQELFNLNADIYIVVAFGQILPTEILDQPKLGCWNSHASLLPLWRGAAPIQWSLINDDLKTGVCIMSMETGLDTGPVIEHEEVDIHDKDNLESLSNKLSNISSKLLINSLERIKKTSDLTEIERLKILKPVDQKTLGFNPSYARQIEKEDYLINWNQTSRKVFKKIKGLYPNAYTIYSGKRIKILDVEIISNKEISQLNKEIENNNRVISPKQFIPGEIIMINKKLGILTMTNDIPILIKLGQLEGKKTTDAFILSKQANLKIKHIFGN